MVQDEISRSEYPRVDVLLPLYGITSKSGALTLPGGLVLRRYSEQLLEELTVEETDLGKFLTAKPPDFLLIRTVHEPWVISNSSPGTDDDRHDALSRFASAWLQSHGGQLQAIFSVLLSLRLFKPGSFLRASAFLILSDHAKIDGEVSGQLKDLSSKLGNDIVIQVCIQIPGSLRPKGMSWVPETVAFELPYISAAPMSLEGEEVPFFEHFHALLSQTLERTQEGSKVSLALLYFLESLSCKDKAQQLVDLITSLEAMFLQETEGIKFRVAQRAANILGRTASERKELFRLVGDFYDLRSKLVHGGLLKPKQVELLNEVPRIREIVRRCLLSVLAIAAERKIDSSFYASFDDMALDDGVRTEMQLLAEELLHAKAVLNR